MFIAPQIGDSEAPNDSLNAGFLLQFLQECVKTASSVDLKSSYLKVLIFFVNLFCAVIKKLFG